MKKPFMISAVLALAFLCSNNAIAHVPYFEHRDFTTENPFISPNGIEQSVAVYAWLTVDGVSPSEDIDYYIFEVTDPMRVYLEVLVPVCTQYAAYAPWFALVGPGLPQPLHPIPLTLPEGYGSLVFPNTVGENPRETFYEPFGNKYYYQGPIFDQIIDTPGTYFVIYWDPDKRGGDYVAVLGAEEIWRPQDILRAIYYTPLIRRGEELHIDCTEP